MFYGCSRLLYVPDISKWNTKNVQSMCSMFEECSSLSCLFDISKWNLNNLIDVSCMFKNCISLVSIPKINLVKEADITDFIKGCVSLKALDFLPENIRNINEELNIINNNFYLLTEPNRKEIYKIVYDKVFIFTKNSSTSYKCAWLARNNDNFVVDYFIKKSRKIDFKKSILYRYLIYLQKNKYNIDNDSLWNAGFILKSPIKESSDSDYNFISDEDENIEDNTSENYTQKIEYF